MSEKHVQQLAAEAAAARASGLYSPALSKYQDIISPYWFVCTLLSVLDLRIWCFITKLMINFILITCLLGSVWTLLGEVTY